MDRIYLKSSKIYGEDGIVNGVLELVDGKIRRIITDPFEISQINAPVEDYGYKRIIPGIIDLHNHGFLGWSFHSQDKEVIKAGAKALPAAGVTAFQPTTRSLRAARMAMEESREGAKMLGIHMEGPFTNPEGGGAGRKTDKVKPTLEKMREYWEESGGRISYVTLSPELEGAYEVMDFLKSQHVIISAGHTTANSEQMKEAIQRGIQAATHTGNAMSPIHHRDVNTLGTVLLDPGVYCELIADFIHICPDMIRIMFKLKDKSRINLISDGNSLSGLPPGRYLFLGREVIIEDSLKICLPDGRIYGSGKQVIAGVENLVEKLGIPLEEVIKMSALNPARLLKIDAQKGSIKPGKDGDIVVIDEDYQVIATYVEGIRAYHRGAEPVLYNPEVDQMKLSVKED